MLERDLQKNIVANLRKKGARVFKSDMPPRGWPDLTILPRDGAVGFLEIKRPGNKPRPEQERRIQQIREMGHFTEWTDSVEGAVEFYNSLLRGKKYG